jgi:hypothetical protein
LTSSNRRPLSSTPIFWMTWKVHTVQKLCGNYEVVQRNQNQNQKRILTVSKPLWE